AVERHAGDHARGDAARALRLEQGARRARAPHRLQRHRGGLRSQAQPAARQGESLAARALGRRSRLRPQGRRPLHGLPAEQGTARPARHRRPPPLARPDGDSRSNDQSPPTSRYHDVEVATLTLPDGRTIAYLRRRVVPPPESMALLREHTVRAEERLDQIAATYLGDPEQ